MPLRLPFELCLIILEHVSDSGDLCSFSLSCHTLGLEAQSRLFRRATPSSIDNHLKFINTIITSPDKLALRVIAYSQWLPEISIKPWIADAAKTSQRLHQLLKNTQIALPLMINLQELTFQCPLRDQHTVFILRNCWDFQLRSLKWHASAYTEELYRCFIPTQPELRHVSIEGPESAAVDNVDPLPLACSRLKSLSGSDQDIRILLPHKAVTHLMWRMAYSTNDGMLSPEQLADLALELGYVRYFVDMHGVMQRDMILRYMPNLTHLEIYVSYHTEFGSLTGVSTLCGDSLRVLVITKLGRLSHGHYVTDRHYTAETAFRNCTSLIDIYMEDLDGYGIEWELTRRYKHYQRQYMDSASGEYSGDVVIVAQEEVHAWWAPHW